MQLPVPEGIRLEADPYAATSVASRLWAWGSGAVLIGSFLPEGFEGYARIAHPGSEGSLPREELTALIDVLQRFTSTPERCWFCVWEGYGFWGGGAALAPHRSGSAFARWWVRRTSLRRARREAGGLPTAREAPEGPHGARDYFLFRGALSATVSFQFGVSYQSPTLWWPDGRAWCVATEIDGCSTYVGAGRGASRRSCAWPISKR